MQLLQTKSSPHLFYMFTLNEQVLLITYVAETSSIDQFDPLSHQVRSESQRMSLCLVSLSMEALHTTALLWQPSLFDHLRVLTEGSPDSRQHFLDLAKI